MAIYLIVGQPRHGKSQFVVSLAHKIHEKNEKTKKEIDTKGDLSGELSDSIRNIYSDIEGHCEKTHYVTQAPIDWRDVPNNSVIFMDEIHKRPEYCDDGRMSSNPMIVDLTTHGHQNKDIYLITQDPERLNKGIRKLVEKMYLVKRPIQKPNFATIYEFERWLRDPWQAAASERSVKYQDSYKFFYKKKWQDMYTSASAHTSINFKIQSKFVYAIIAIICLMSISYYLFTKSGGDKLARTAISGLKGDQLEVKTQTSKTENTDSVASDPEQLSDQCRKGENVDKPECKKWFNDLTNNNASVSTGDNGRTVVSYNPSKPFDDEDIRKNISYEVTSKPLFSGCMQKNGLYVAYTEQGTILKDVSQEDCKRLIADGDRPYNYFKNDRTDYSSTETLNNVSTQNYQPNKEELARFQEARENGLI